MSLPARIESTEDVPQVDMSHVKCDQMILLRHTHLLLQSLHLLLLLKKKQERCASK